DGLRFQYRHPEIRIGTSVRVEGPGRWDIDERRVATRVEFAAGASAVLRLEIEAEDVEAVPDGRGEAARYQHRQQWYERLTRVAAAGDPIVAGLVNHAIRDLGSLALLEGERDEWLAPSAGMPLYPALFGRDAVTAAWQVAALDRGELLDAALSRLQRCQGMRVHPALDEEPGRIVQQVRRGPLSRLGLVPFARYYGDFASPLMFVVSLAQLYAWTGQRKVLERHWDAARRILDWARDYADSDGDGYLEYRTQAQLGPKHQGWKDSGNAVLYEDGRPVASPIATCELQGYWYAAQHLLAFLCAALGHLADAKAHWQAAKELKERFNREWWMEEEGFLAMAMDPDKRLVRTVGSNAGHCLTAGIVSDAHLRPLVGRLFAPDLFSGWGIRTLSTSHPAYNPVSYHLGSLWTVENATIAFGLRRYGFDVRALELAQAIFELAQLYQRGRVPECVGGYARGDYAHPSAYPQANVPQAWNQSALPLLLQTILGLQPVALLDLLVVDPVLPSWIPDLTLENLRVGGATATIRFWRDRHGKSHAEVLRRQ
ncbi:MAG TPA: amylo-alpha-1,6-glucosidase, partial [Gemmatimonadales bacterium]|nr:amylo-alpha-1,6-glucosidase [Gemmatimonadales bacterium]